MTNDSFISYDDPRSCMDKVQWTRKEGLGGVMVWDISAQFISPDSPILKAIYMALR